MNVIMKCLEMNGIINPFHLVSGRPKDAECLRPLITFKGQCQESIGAVQQEKRSVYANLIKNVIYMPLESAASYKAWTEVEIRDLELDLWLVAGSICSLVISLKGADFFWNYDCTLDVNTRCMSSMLECAGMCMTFAGMAGVSTAWFVYQTARNHFVKESGDMISLDLKTLEDLDKKESRLQNLKNYADLKIDCVNELHPEILDNIRQKYFKLIQEENKALSAQ